MVRGSCLCGGVAFEIEGELTPINLCHAQRCRKATGAAAAPEMLAPADGLRFVRGSELVREYEAPLLSEPPAYRRAFCGTCGSPLPIALSDMPYYILIAGVLDDDPGTREFRHGFTLEKAAWHTITGELPQYESRPPLPDPDPGLEAVPEPGAKPR